MQKRGKTEASIVFVRGGNEVSPIDGAGLGACDVAAFALRAAAICLSRPALRRLLVVDEPFKHVSAEYRECVGEMLEMMSEELDLQIIMVTHYEEHQFGTVHRLR